MGKFAGAKKIGLRWKGGGENLAGMKKVFLAVVVLAAGATGGAQERFSERLTPEQRKAAGLDQLSPEQRAALDALVAGDQAAGEKRRREEVRKELRAEVKAEVKAEAKAEVRKEVDEQRMAEVRILSKIAGKFDGWDGRTVFPLENGQVWRQNEPGLVYVRAVMSPPVLLEKMYGGWRLYYEGVGWVRVVRIK